MAASAHSSPSLPALVTGAVLLAMEDRIFEAMWLDVGLKLRDIQDITGLSLSRQRTKARRLGLPLATRSPRIAAETVAGIVAAYEAREPCVSIADRFGVNPSIYRFVKRAGRPLRSRKAA
jgi:hypothetical protein